MIHVLKTQIQIDPRLSDGGERWKIKLLPGWSYFDDPGLYVIPIRPGLADALLKVFGSEIETELIRAREVEFLGLIEPPALGTVDPFKVGANAAVELSLLNELYNKFDGDEIAYLRKYPGPEWNG